MIEMERYSTPINEDTIGPMMDRMGIAPDPEPIVNRNGHRGRFDAAGFIARHLKVQRSTVEANGTKYVLSECPFDAGHNADSAVFVGTDGRVGFKCFHNGCAGKKWQDVRRLFEPGCYDRANGYQSEGPHVMEPPKSVTYQRITSAELASTDYQLEYLIDDALVAGQPMIVGGPKKALKTSMIVDLAVSLAIGGYFLGKLRCNRPARVAVMSGESGLATLKEIALRVSRVAKCDLGTLDGLIWFPVVPRFGDLAHLDALERLIGADKIDVLVIDPAYLAIPSGDNGNLFAQGELLLGVAELCQRHNVTLIVAHHTGKSRQTFEPPDLDDLSWSGFAEFARQWILLGRRERYKEGTGEHRLWLSTGGSAGHSMLWAMDVSEGNRNDPGGRKWDVALSVPSEARQRVEEERERQKIEKQEQLEVEHQRRLLTALRLHPEGETKACLREQAGLSDRTFGQAILAVLQTGRAEACQVMKNRRLENGYKATGK